MIQRVCILGPGKTFLSGISYYTIRLSNAFAEQYQASVILFRHLVPKWLFPGRKRVGKSISNLEFDASVQRLDGMDWYLIPNILKLPHFLRKNEPQVFIFQWWTSSVVHIYLCILMLIRIFSHKSRLILLFHETLDPLEDSILPLKIYARLMGKWCFQFFNAYAVHSRADLETVHQKFKLPKEKLYIVTHGPYDHFVQPVQNNEKEDNAICHLLYFGLIRPYKGVDYLIRAFNQIPESLISRYKLVIAGEPWGVELDELIAQSPYRNRIKFIDKYIDDEEVNVLFSEADVAVFPYTRASQSGAAHIPICYGIPIIVSKVGGLVESMSKYDGTIFIEPKNESMLTDALVQIYDKRKERFKNPHSWQRSVKDHEQIFKAIEI